jgi:hypothetical protein
VNEMPTLLGDVDVAVLSDIHVGEIKEPARQYRDLFVVSSLQHCSSHEEVGLLP